MNIEHVSAKQYARFFIVPRLFLRSLALRLTIPLAAGDNPRNAEEASASRVAAAQSPPALKVFHVELFSQLDGRKKKSHQDRNTDQHLQGDGRRLNHV